MLLSLPNSKHCTLTDKAGQTHLKPPLSTQSVPTVLARDAPYFDLRQFRQTLDRPLTYDHRHLTEYYAQHRQPLFPTIPLSNTISGQTRRYSDLIEPDQYKDGVSLAQAINTRRISCLISIMFYFFTAPSTCSSYCGT